MLQCVTAMVEYDHKVYKGTGYNKFFFAVIKDVKVMRYRAHVLHSLLEGFVQR